MKLYHSAKNLASLMDILIRGATIVNSWTLDPWILFTLTRSVHFYSYRIEGIHCAVAAQNVASLIASLIAAIKFASVQVIGSRFVSDVRWVIVWITGTCLPSWWNDVPTDVRYSCIVAQSAPDVQRTWIIHRYGEDLFMHPHSVN